MLDLIGRSDSVDSLNRGIETFDPYGEATEIPMAAMYPPEMCNGGLPINYFCRLA